MVPILRRHPSATFQGVLAAVALLGLTEGCASESRKAGDSPRRLRIANTATFADVPAIAALGRLKEQGYLIESIDYAQTALAAQALAAGDVDVAFGGFSTYWTAASRGAPIAAVMELARIHHVLVASKPITKCSDLSARRLAVNGLGASGASLLKFYLAEECSGTEPHVLVMPGSPTRLAAFLAGAVDAAAVMREDFIEIQQRAPDRIGLVEDFGIRWPDIAITGVMVNVPFSRAHAQSIDDLVIACLAEHRAVAHDPVRLARLAQSLLGAGDKDYLPTATAFVQANSWDLNGGLTPHVMTRTVQFLARAGAVPADTDPDSMIDRSFLDRALDVVGRQPSRAVPAS